MTVDVIEPGRVVRVTPDDSSLTGDVLEYAEALIEEEGWLKMDPKAPKESSRETGWTLHDAIGEANIRLFSGNKEGPKVRGATVRAQAVAAVQNALPVGQKDDKAYNDKAKDKATVLGVLRRAQKGVAA